MGFFDEGGIFGDALGAIGGMFGPSSANAADMPIPRDPGGGLAGAAGINDIGSNVGPPVDQVAGVPPASQTLAPTPGTTGLPGSNFAGPPAMMAPGGGAAAPPLPPPQNIPTSVGPTPPPIASSTSTGPPGTNPADQPATGRQGLLDNLMSAIGKNPNTPPGSGLFSDPRTARQFAGSLGAGLSAAGNSAGKSPMQAAFGGAGAAIQGGEKADDTGTEQQRRATASERENQRLQEVKRRNDQMYDVYQKRLQRAQQVGTVQSRAQAWETSDYGRLQHANAEILKGQAEIRQNYRADLNAAATAGQSVSGQTPDQIRALMKKEQDELKAGVYKQYNVNPDELQKRGSAVFGDDGKIDLEKTKAQAHKPTSVDDFHATVRPGHFFVNPADGKLMLRKSAAPPPIDQGGTMQAQPNFMTPPGATPDYGGGYQTAGMG